MSTTVPIFSAVGSSARFAPAVVRGARLLVECPSWCTVDHVVDSAGAVEDIWHASDNADLSAPRMGQMPELMAYAKVALDAFASEARKRVPFIAVEDASSEGYDMTPAEALVFADNLEAFAAQIRAMARTAGGVA